MNRKEIAEIESCSACKETQFTLSTDVMLILRKISYLNSSIRPYPSEDELFKYLDIFRKALFRKEGKKFNTGGFSSVGRICRWNTTLFISILQWNG